MDSKKKKNYYKLLIAMLKEEGKSGAEKVKDAEEKFEKQIEEKLKSSRITPQNFKSSELYKKLDASLRLSDHSSYKTLVTEMARQMLVDKFSEKLAEKGVQGDVFEDGHYLQTAAISRYFSDLVSGIDFDDEQGPYIADSFFSKAFDERNDVVKEHINRINNAIKADRLRKAGQFDTTTDKQLQRDGHIAIINNNKIPSQPPNAATKLVETIAPPYKEFRDKALELVPKDSHKTPWTVVESSEDLDNLFAAGLIK